MSTCKTPLWFIWSTAICCLKFTCRVCTGVYRHGILSINDGQHGTSPCDIYTTRALVTKLFAQMPFSILAENVSPFTELPHIAVASAWSKLLFHTCCTFFNKGYISFSFSLTCLKWFSMFQHSTLWVHSIGRAATVTFGMSTGNK